MKELQTKGQMHNLSLQHTQRWALTAWIAGQVTSEELSWQVMYEYLSIALMPDALTFQCRFVWYNL